nr:hypothetical protein [Georgfuchsia toluolica]
MRIGSCLGRTAIRGRQIDLVGADAKAANGGQFRCLTLNFFCQTGARTQANEMRVADRLDQLGANGRMGMCFRLVVTILFEGFNCRRMNVFKLQKLEFSFYQARGVVA